MRSAGCQPNASPGAPRPTSKAENRLTLLDKEGSSPSKGRWIRAGPMGARGARASGPTERVRLPQRSDRTRRGVWGFGCFAGETRDGCARILPRRRGHRRHPFCARTNRRVGDQGGPPGRDPRAAQAGGAGARSLPVWRQGACGYNDLRPPSRPDGDSARRAVLALTGRAGRARIHAPDQLLAGGNSGGGEGCLEVLEAKDGWVLGPTASASRPTGRKGLFLSQRLLQRRGVMGPWARHWGARRRVRKIDERTSEKGYGGRRRAGRQ